MNTKKAVVAAITVISIILSVPLGVLGADYSLSPGLVIIKNKTELKKCGVINCDISFTADDFNSIAGGSGGLEYITLTSLPSPENGVLKLSGRDVAEGQSISEKNLDLLRYVPKLNTTSTDFFTFTCDGKDDTTSIKCSLSILDSVNLAPETAAQSLKTVKNCSLIKFFKAADPDGDEMCFDVVSQPKNGTVEITDMSTGLFTYHPEKNFTGKDSFTYVASDIYGNNGKLTKVNVSVAPRKSELVFKDMDGHWAQSSVMKMCDLGLMSGDVKGLVATFAPEDAVTRGDFLAMAMIMTGNEDKVSQDAMSVFADNSDIPSNIRCYAAAAYSMGVVSGYEENGIRYFNWQDNVTRAEAAVMLARLIEEPEPAINTEFTDAAAIPGWATGAVQTLVSCGIMNGDGTGNILPDKALTKAEAAELLCNAADYLEEKEETEKKSEKKGFLSFLPFFG